MEILLSRFEIKCAGAAKVKAGNRKEIAINILATSQQGTKNRNLCTSFMEMGVWDEQQGN